MAQEMRKWTESEIDAMTEYIKAKQPVIFEELVLLEKSDAEIDFNVSRGLALLIMEVHPNADRFDQISLRGEVRIRLRESLGLIP